MPSLIFCRYIASSLDISVINVAMDDTQPPKTNAVSAKPGFVCHNHIIPEKKI